MRRRSSCSCCSSRRWLHQLANTRLVKEPWLPLPQERTMELTAKQMADPLRKLLGRWPCRCLCYRQSLSPPSSLLFPLFLFRFHPLSLYFSLGIRLLLLLLLVGYPTLSSAASASTPSASPWLWQLSPLRPLTQRHQQQQHPRVKGQVFGSPTAAVAIVCARFFWNAAVGTRVPVLSLSRFVQRSLPFRVMTTAN